MAKINTLNYQTVASWNGSQDLFVVEQPDGTKVATPEQIKQYVLNDMDEVPTENSNNPVKSGGIFSAVDDVYSVMGQMGAKNLIPRPYADGEEKTQNNMTYTVNTDGTITATATQALTNDATFYLYRPTDTEELVLKAGVKYVLSGDPTASGVERIVVTGRSAAGGTSETLIINNTGVPKEYTPDVDKVITSIYIRIYAGASSPIPYNETFKPMLRLAADTDNTYQPYAKTNKELTEVIGDLSQTGLTGDSVAAQLGAAKGQISDLTTKKVNTWMPDVYDFDTKVKTLDPSICITYVQKIGDLTVAYLGVESGTDLGSFSTMMQLRGFPEGCTRCIGGYIYNSSLESSPRVVQASNVGVYFRPNITGSMSSGFVSALLFFN